MTAAPASTAAAAAADTSTTAAVKVNDAGIEAIVTGGSILKQGAEAVRLAHGGRCRHDSSPSFLLVCPAGRVVYCLCCCSDCMLVIGWVKKWWQKNDSVKNIVIRHSTKNSPNRDWPPYDLPRPLRSAGG